MASARLDHGAVHLGIDMQRLFAEETPWRIPGLPRILPRILPRVGRIAERHPERNIFTRFIPPQHPARSAAPGATATSSGRR